MVNKYDLFFEIAARGSLITSELAKRFSLRQVKKEALYYHIAMLVKEGFITRKKETLTVIQTKKNQMLFSILNYCAQNNLDYGFYLETSTVHFLENHFFHTKHSLSINTRTKLIRRLSKDSFLVLFTKKPYHYMILYHTLFEQILLYFTSKKATFSYHVNKKIISLNQHRIKKTKSMHQEDERIKFLHTSLFLEGNLLTLRETVKLIQEGDLIAGGKYKDIAQTKGY